MAFKPIEGNDGGLLMLAHSLRLAADRYALAVANHNGAHPDHGLTDCDSPAFVELAHDLIAVGTALTGSGANMLEAWLGDVTDDGPETPTDRA